ncbi:MAG: aldo/keto reductase [Campylobacterota bacterium]|nr:aldo/keto reductase [Campylobacterota bacterium]
MSTEIGFGTYRIVDENLEHLQALKLAIESGVKIIDTSSNYMNGASEYAIAKAINMLDDDFNIEIISKYGYIQGKLLEEVKEENNIDGLVEYSDSCYHAISPEFMHEQLTSSLRRLSRDSIECYLIHNPEYYLYEALNKNVNKETMLDTMMQRIYEAFVGLEKEVLKGRIKSYGVSSNSFAKASSEADFLPYEDLVIFAKNAAEEVGNDVHSFTTIELPINLLEQDGLQCAAWAKENGLRVIANRPLNAQRDSMMFRLADYDEPSDYFHHLNEILDLCDNDVLKPIYTIIEQLDSNRHRFGWIGEYDSFFYTQVIPHLQNTVSTLSEDDRDILIESLNLFFEQLKKMVAYECSKSTRSQLKVELNSCEDSLQQCAINFLKNTNLVDVILVGMRKPSYVTDITTINL